MCREFTLLLSVALGLEYESICKAPAQRIAAGLKESEVEVIMSALCAVAEPVRSRFLWRPQLRDPADEMVLEAAINGNADALVTFTRRDFGDAAVRMTQKQKQTSIYPLRLPSSLKMAVREISREDGTSINQFVATAVAEKITAMRTAEFFAERSDEADIQAARRLLKRSGGEPPEPSDRLGEAEVEGR